MRHPGKLLTALSLFAACCAATMAAPTRIIHISDTQNGSTNLYVNTNVLNNIITSVLALNPRPNAVVVSGDVIDNTLNVDGFNDYRLFTNCMNRLVTNGVPYYCAIGNHDAATVYGADPIWYSKWRNAFSNFPANGPTNWLDLAYYADVGAARLIVCDCITGGTNWVDPGSGPTYRIDGTQAVWLASVIGTNSPKSFDIVVAHSAAYPVSTLHTNSALNIWPTNRDAFLQILVDAKATAYLVGHDHICSLREMDTRYNTNWTCTIPEIMTISGGDLSGHVPNSTIPISDVLITGLYCYAVIDLDPATSLGTSTTYTQDGSQVLYQVMLKGKGLGLMMAFTNSIVPENAGVLTNWGRVIARDPVLSNTTVTLQSSDTGKIVVAGSVMIPAGSASAAFDMTALNAGLYDGTQAVAITAHTAGVADGTGIVVFADACTLTVTSDHGGAVPAAGVHTNNYGSVVTCSVTNSPVFDGGLSTQYVCTGWTGTGSVPANGTGTNTTFSMTNRSTIVWNWQGEPPGLILSFSNSVVSEADGTLTNFGSVAIAGPLVSNLTVSLTSDTAVITVPASVVIQAGTVSTMFNVGVVNDSLRNGTRTATITARAGGFVDGTNSLAVLDDDVDHFSFAAIASPQTSGIPFAVTIAARDTNGVLITRYTGSVNLTASGNAGPVPVQPASATLTNGQWSGNMTAWGAATNVQLTANDGAGHTGSSNPFDTISLVVDHFVWSPISTQQFANVPFMVAITAKDSNNLTVADFTGTVSIAGYVDQAKTVGSGALADGYPMGTVSNTVRDQVIYTASDLGNACRLTALSLYVTAIPGQTMTNWTIRLKHTATEAYSPTPSWDSNGWSVVYQANETISSTGWTAFAFSTPFDYDGSNNVMVDFSFHNSNHTANGQCWYTTATNNRSARLRTSTNYGDPLTWSGTNPPAAISARYPSVIFSAEEPVPTWPTSKVSFAGGVFTGPVIVHAEATNMYLHAYDASGHTGDGNLFTTIPGIYLSVSSQYGMAVPPDGSNAYQSGTVMDCAITNSPVYDGVLSTQYVCTGWTGTGSVTNGTGTNTTFVLTTNSILTWKWQTNYWLNTEVSGNGSIDVPDSWIAAGSNPLITATPAADWHFAGWSGNTGSCIIAGSQITVPMNMARLIVADFAPDVVLTNFGYSMKIRFAGYGAGEMLTNFPALVVLNGTRSCAYGSTPTNLNYSQFASPNGYDLRFTDTDTNLLSYEQENWDTNGDSYVWVRVPRLTGTNTCIWAWWGSTNDTARPAYTTNGTTWRSDYLGVWHLKQDQAGISNAAVYFDSTARGNDGFDNVSATGKTGVVYLGQQFDGIDDYVQLESAPAVGAPLGSSNFTLSIWFRRMGTGITATTGTGGTDAEPLLTKGRGEYDGDNRDMNYFLGIDSNLVLAADMEEGIGGTTLGLNHPVAGITIVPSNVWCYAAVSYDGTWNLYLNGSLESQLYVGKPPRWDSIQPAAIGTALMSGGQPLGTFNGCLDEARVAFVAHSANWIKACYATVASNSVFTAYSAEPFLASAHNYAVTIASALGGANPAVGTNVFTGGSLLTCAITNSPLLDNTTQYVCVGWTGTGSAPASGSGTSTPAFFLVADSSVTWNWQMNYWLGASTNGHGSISNGNVWVQAGATATVSALPAQYYRFSGWSGDVGGGNTNSTPLLLTMDRPRMITASFDAILATNQTPQWWLAKYYGGTSNFDGSALSDTDGDGMPAWQEFRAGTDPTNALSVFRITMMISGTNGDDVVSWSSVTGKYYGVFMSTDLLQGWLTSPLVSNVPGDISGTNTYTNSSGPERGFYRIGVR